MDPIILRLIAFGGEMAVKELLKWWDSLTPEAKEAFLRDVQNVPQDATCGDGEKG